MTPEGRVKLLDLGLARFLQDQVGDASLTRQGTGLGTPDYAAPEQFRDAHRADARSDVYALGCTLYHLIGGRVPFPGSSMSEKVEAHETKGPQPLEELCPEVPAGLALAVRRMMAKRPADHFRTMAELAEALMPYVAGSSAAFPQIRDSATWDGSRLATATVRPRRRLTAWAGVAAAVLLLPGAVGLVGFMAGRLRPDGSQVAGNRSTEPAPADASPKRDEPATAADDPNVLTVSRQAKDGGKYPTISAALVAVKPGQTIRVLDEATYPEALRIRLANVILEAPRRATLAFKGAVGLTIANVSGFTLRGFKLRGGPGTQCLVHVAERAGGTVLEELDLSADGGTEYRGFNLEDVKVADAEPPVIVRNNIVRGAANGLRISGLNNDGTALRCRRITVRDNAFANCEIGIYVQGLLQHVQLVGNRVWGAPKAGMVLAHLLKDSEGVVIANNTVFDSGSGFDYFDDVAKADGGKGVLLRNNLILACPADMTFKNSGGHLTLIHGPGDGKALYATWFIGHNGREGAAGRGQDKAGSPSPPAT